MSLSTAFTATSPLLARTSFTAFSHQCSTKRRPRKPFFSIAVPKRFAVKPVSLPAITTSQLNDDMNSVGDNERPPEGPERPQQRKRSLFVTDADEDFWESAQVDSVFAPLKPEEEEILKSKLPLRLAQFFIDRADDANRLRQPSSSTNSSNPINTLFSDLPPDTPDWNDPRNESFKDYVYVTTTGPPSKSFRRRGSSLFGGGDGLPDPDEDTGLFGQPYVYDDGEQIIKPVNDPNSIQYKTSQPRVASLFVGQVDSIDEQASRLGYGIIAILAFSFVLKLVFAVISFFLSFTFSFFAIFALSAGLFVLFFLIRF